MSPSQLLLAEKEILGFVAGRLLKTISQGSVEVKKPKRNVRNEYRRNKEHDYASVYIMVC